MHISIIAIDIILLAIVLVALLVDGTGHSRHKSFHSQREFKILSDRMVVLLVLVYQ